MSRLHPSRPSRARLRAARHAWPVIAVAVMLTLAAPPTGSAQVPFEPGDWPQWRGPNRDGVAVEEGLLREWPAAGPSVAWRVDGVGVGFSSVAVHGGRVFTLGDLDGVEHMVVVDLETGRRIWAAQPAPVVKALADAAAREFRRLDGNVDGGIDEVEALRGFGWNFTQFDGPVAGDADARLRGRAAAVFQKLDADGDGRLSHREAGNALRDRFDRADRKDASIDAGRLATERAAPLLAAADKDGDGAVSRQEARGAEIDRFFARADQRLPDAQAGDGIVTAAELAEYLLKSEPGRDGWVTETELVGLYLDERPVGDGRLSHAELTARVGGYRNGMGHGPRGTPTVDGPRVYMEGAMGDVACLNAADGSTVWHVNLNRDFGGSTPGWGYSESPLVVADLVIVTPGGSGGTLVALDKRTGTPVWRSKEIVDATHYSSPVLADIAGVRQVVQFSNKRVFGVAVEDGRLLWSYESPANRTANCCTPIVADDFVFASSAYGTGSGLARIAASGTTQQAEQVYFEKRLACHHGGVVKVGEHLYSNAGGAVTCMHFKTGRIAWQSRGVGKGSLVAADGMLYMLSEGHKVALAEANPQAYVERGQFAVEPRGKPSWSIPVVAHGKLLIRDQDVLTAYDIRSR